jgi:hypothetical protein
VDIAMQKVIMTAVNDGGSSGAEPLAETVSLNFAEVIDLYTRQNREGAGGDEVAIGWSIRENKCLPTWSVWPASCRVHHPQRPLPRRPALGGARPAPVSAADHRDPDQHATTPADPGRQIA